MSGSVNKKTDSARNKSSSRGNQLNLNSFMQSKSRSLGEIKDTKLNRLKKKNLTDFNTKHEYEEVTRSPSRLNKRTTRNGRHTAKSKVVEINDLDGEAELELAVQGINVDDSDEVDSKGSDKPKSQNLSSSPRRGRKLVTNSIYSNQSFSQRSRGMSEMIQQSLVDLTTTASFSALNRPDRNSRNDHAANEGIKDATVHSFDIDLAALHQTIEFGPFKYDHFDFFNKAPEEMTPYITDALNQLDLDVVYNHDEELITSFLLEVSKRYKSSEEVPFHNFYHGFSVAQMAIIFVLRSKQMKGMYDRKALFTLIIAAVSHDVAHPGNDNFYEIATKSQNAKVFNEKSVLENYHTKTTLELLKGNPTTGDMPLNVFKHLKPETQEESFKEIAFLILSTDMSQHGKHLEFLRGVKSLKSMNAIGKPDDLELLLEAVIHACDLSGQCFSTELAQEWEFRIHSEMSRQWERLMKQNHSVPKHLEYLKLGEGQLKARYESQVNFIQFALVPYWTEIVRLFPSMHDFLENLKINQRWFETEAKKL